MSRRTQVAVLAASLALAAPALATAPDAIPGATTSHAVSGGEVPQGRHDNSYLVGLWGDVPYGPEGRSELPALVADMNAERLAFSIHIGDIKSGSERCDDALYTSTRTLFESYRRPVVYTPGDNEWTDCHRANNGAYDPLERLRLLRSTFYAQPRQSLGQRELRVTPQSREYPENVRWSRGPVTFATVHVVGSNNNKAAPGDGGRPPEVIAAANREYEARNRANLAWIREAFAQATRRGHQGVVIAMQADMDLTGQFEADTTSGFIDTVATLRRETQAFDGEVALLHGDSHVFIHDKPLRDETNHVIDNFTRVETFGATETDWVAIRVNPDGRNLFTVEPRIVRDAG